MYLINKNNKFKNKKKMLNNKERIRRVVNSRI